MNFFGKSLFFFLVILLFASIYHDITLGSFPLNNELQKTKTVSYDKKVYVKVLPGETVLSIVERYNKTKTVNIDQIISDFKKLNPHAESYQLKSYQFYYFPLY
ncbi:LisM domain containing protein [Virgibacillus sp. DJP39]|uniref:LisM domain containing protein n=1 Tax=Virgibacillus sp. DJP39 TaxID=3409790 RepID=UPI003BB5836E